MRSTVSAALPGPVSRHVGGAGNPLQPGVLYLLGNARRVSWWIRVVAFRIGWIDVDMLAAADA